MPRLPSKRRLITTALAALGLGGLASMRFMGVQTTTILITVIGLLVAAVGAVVVWAMRSRKSGSGGIEAALKAQADREAAAYTPDRKAEVERMRESFDAAVARLTSSKLAGTGMFKSGKKALYALPWYLFVGPPGSGKTTALVHSGLRFPGGAERVRGVGGTRNCDWFFTDEAILLDTAGRYTTEDEDSEEWDAFLDALRESRPDRPINGVLVGVSTPDLLGTDARGLEDMADDVRRRVDELVERLGLRIPVYLMLTKTDLVPGFVEMFGEMDRNGREQVWGATVEPADMHDAGAAIEREFDGLVEALRPIRNARLGQPLHREERQRVYGFALEFDALRDRVARFANLLFVPNPLGDGPVFRGFYFTSGTQEGAPIDRVLSSLAAQFGLSGPPPAPAPVETKSYFLKNLFTDVVFPDQHLATRTQRAAGASWRALTKAGAGALGIAALAAILLGFAAARSTFNLDRINERAEDSAKVTFLPDGTRFSELTRVDKFREEAEALGQASPMRRFLLLGLDRSGTVREPVQRLYYSQARDLVRVYALAQIEQSLGRSRTFSDSISTATAAQVATARVDIENDLEAYALLTTASDSLRTSATLRDALKVRLAELAPLGALGQGGRDNQDNIDLVVRQTNAYVDGLAAGLAEPFQANASLIAAARVVVDVPPSLDGLYARIRRESLARIPPFTLARAVLPKHLPLFARADSVPGFFTQEAWASVVESRFREASANPAGEYWLFGRTQADLPAELRDPDAIFDALLTRYYAEYTASWQRFITSVRYKRAEGADATARLTALGSTTDSPIAWLFATVSEQTTFPAEPASAQGRGLVDRAAAAIGRGPAADSSGGDLDPVARAFAGLHRFNAAGLETQEADAGLYQALEALTQFGRGIGRVAGDGAQAAELLAITKDEIETGTRGLDSRVRQNLFFAPLDISQRVAVTRAEGAAAEAAAAGGAAAAAAAAAAAEDAAEVASSELDAAAIDARAAFSETLAGRYPFSSGSSRDAALDDVRAYFGPGGTLDAFAEAAGPDPPPGIQRAIEKGRTIGRVLFGGSQLTFRLRPDLPTYSSQTAQRALEVEAVAIGIHGANNVYRLGSTRFLEVAWPGSPGAFVTVQRRDGTLSKEYEGDWALFRLFQDARVRSKGGTNYDVSWTFTDGGNTVTAHYELITTSSDTPLANPRSFFQFSLPRP